MKRLLCCFVIAAFVTSIFPATGNVATVQARKPKGRALLVGINRYKHPDIRPVKGAKEDVSATQKLINEQYGFAAEEIHTLIDAEATHEAILREFENWLIADTRPGDRVFFLFSGHGSQLPDNNGDEADRFDETLVPYDVDITGKNQIRDDELESLVKQLAGRLSVLIFDSCHSGTVTRAIGGGKTDKENSIEPRYLPTPAEFAKLKTGSRAIGGNQTGYEVQEVTDEKLLVTRDLHLIREEVAKTVSGLIIISAARPSQVAFPMLIESDEYNGALTYAFCQSQIEKPSLTLGELQQTVMKKIADWQENGKLKGKQKPIFEISSPATLLNQPLFPMTAQQLAVPAIALANPASAMKVTLRNLEGKTKFAPDDEVSYEVTTNQAGWLYLIVFSERDVASCVFPDKDSETDSNNYVQTGKHRLPREGAYEARKPYGKDITVALFSKNKLNLGEKEIMTWDEVFDRLQTSQLRGYVNTRGIGIKKPSSTKPSTAILSGTDWQAASLVTETIEKARGK